MILVWVLCCALSCGRSSPLEQNTQQGPPKGASEQNAPAKNNGRLAVGPIELFAKGSGSYTKLERWKESHDSAHHQAFVVHFTIENQGNSAIQDGDFIVVTTVDFVIAPTFASSGDVEKIIEGHNWSRVNSVNDITLGKVPYLEPKGVAGIRMQVLELDNLFKAFDGKQNALWPWALRVNVRVVNRDMTPEALGRLILPMIPSDRRLNATDRSHSQ